MKLENICYILNTFPLPSETFIADEATSMIDIGVTAHVFSLRRGEMDLVQPSAKALLDKNMTTYMQSAPRRAQMLAVFICLCKRPWKAGWCLLQALFSTNRWMYFLAAPYAVEMSKNNIQFMHAHFADFNLSVAEILSSWTGIPFGVTTHGADLRNDPLPLSEIKKLYDRADLIVTVSEWNKRFMIEKYGIPAANIEVVHCGIDVGRFKSAENTGRIQGKTLKLIHVGRLVPEKGQDLLLEALAKVRANGVHFEMQIVGAGELEELLKSLARDLQLEECVDFVGAQSQQYVIESLQSSDIFVLSSRSEGLPIVCMEAMSSGVLVVAPRINGIPELIEHRVSGLLVPPEDPDALALAIVEAARNRSAMVEMTMAAKTRVEAEFCRRRCSELLAIKMAKAASLECYGEAP